MCGWGRKTGSQTTSQFNALLALADGSLETQRISILFQEAAGNSKAVLSIQTITALTLTSTTSIVSGEWGHVLGMFRSATDFELYLNGVSEVAASTTITFPTGLDVFALGRIPDSTPSSIADNQDIAECAIWDVALTQLEITALASGISPNRVRTTGLQGYWPVHGETSNEPDFSKNGNNMAVTGTVKADHAPVGRSVRSPTNFIFVPEAPSLISESSSFNQSWQVAFPDVKTTSTLNQVWQTFGVDKGNSNLSQSWIVDKFTPVTSSFNQNWAIDPVAVKSKTSNLGQKWQALSVTKSVSNAQQNWKIFVRTKATSYVNQKWLLDPIASKTFSDLHNKYSVFVLDKTQSTLGQSWSVVAPLPDFSSLNQKWVIEPVVTKGLLSELGQQWVVSAGPFTSWTLPYSINVSTPWILPYNAIVSQSWILPSLGTVNKAWELPYSLTADLAKQFELIWDLDTGNDIAQSWSLPYNYGKVSAQWELTYSLLTPVAEQWSLDYGLTFPVAEQWSLDWDVNTFDNVKQSWKLVYAWIGPEIINISGQPTITLAGKVIDVFDAEISTDEEGFIWQAEITLLDIKDYKSINIDDQFTLNFYGEIFTLLTESKTLDRSSPVGLAMTVRAVSPAIRHDFPRAAPLSVTYTTPVMAKATAEAVLGESITWDIPDWLIPANRLGIADGAPIQLVQQIVSAVGGVLESNPDGTLVTRPKFPVSMNIMEDDTQTLPIAQNYFDTADNLSVSEEYTPQKLFNKFRISDTVKEFDDDLDFDFDEITEEDGSTTKSDTEGLLKAFVKPFRTNVVVKSSQDASIGFQLNGVSTEQLTELVEIKESVGNVSKPIFTLDSFEYQAIDLGTPLFVVDDTQIVTPNVNLKYGLVEITYTTHFIEYSVTGVPSKNVQFILENIEV